MARYPGAVYREVRGLSNDPPIEPIGIILHSSASKNATSLFGWFDGPSGGIESHLHIPNTEAHDTEQYRDTNREADANYKGNSWYEGGVRLGFLSVETQGTGYEPWTPHQLQEIINFCLWAAEKHPRIKLRRAPGYRSAGVGYHVQFGAGEGVNGWSNARGKICPGPLRIKQYNEVILPVLAKAAILEKPVVGPTPVKPVLAWPAFPLRENEYFGPRDPISNIRSVSGYFGHSNDLKVWQQRMGSRGWDIDDDGLYGPQTERVARLFQEQLGVKPDGLVGPFTWKAAWTAPVK